MVSNSALQASQLPHSLPGLDRPLAQLSPRQRRKIGRKWHQAALAISPAQLSSEPTECLLVSNAGLHNGVGQSDLFKLGLQGIVKLVQPAGQSHCLMLFESTDSAVAAAYSLQFCQLAISRPTSDDDSGPVLYAFFVNPELALSAVQMADASEVVLNNPADPLLPPGLSLILDALSLDEEADLLALVDAELLAGEAAGHLRCRRVLHWGHEFIYGRNRLAPLPDRPLPPACSTLANCLTPDWLPRADQLTVNVYEPGGGIAPHVDSHAAFGDYILAVSLGSGCAFRLSRPGQSAVSLALPARSALLLTGEARLIWRHEVPARLADLIDGDLVRRGRRVSFTFRQARPAGLPCRCGLTEICDEEDSAGIKDCGSSCIVASTQPSPSPSLDPASLERDYVHNVYDTIADHFSDTRHSRWPRVAAFLAGLPAGSLLIDVGCGNGKNMLARRDILTIGCDRSIQLCGVCVNRGLPVFQADALQLPLRTGAFDAAICIAVLHHLSTRERRLASLRELGRVSSPGAHLLIYVWALEQRRKGQDSAYLNSNKKSNKKTHAELDDHSEQFEDRRDSRTGLDVHRPGTEFKQSDMLVPWRGRSDEQSLRFYHLFSEGELDQLCADCGLFELIESYYDNGNWCVCLLRNQYPA